MRSVRIGQAIVLLAELARGSCVATVVDIFPAGEIPDPVKVKLYYKIKESQKGMTSCFKALSTERIVMQRPEGSYIVLPNTPTNTRLWR